VLDGICVCLKMYNTFTVSLRVCVHCMKSQKDRYRSCLPMALVLKCLTPLLNFILVAVPGMFSAYAVPLCECVARSISCKSVLKPLSVVEWNLYVSSLIKMHPQDYYLLVCRVVSGRISSTFNWNLLPPSSGSKRKFRLSPSFTGFLPGLLFECEESGSTFLRNVRELLPDDIALHPRRQSLSQ
jgi:hypothetical protein